MKPLKPHEEVEQMIVELLAEILKAPTADHGTDAIAASYWAKLDEHVEKEDEQDGTARQD